MRTLNRIILEDKTIRTRVNGAFEVDVRCIVSALKVEETSRTNKVDRVLVYAFINGSAKLRGQACRWTGRKTKTGAWKRGPVSVSKKSPKAVERLGAMFDLERMRSEAFGEAIKCYMETLGELDGEVSWFSSDQGTIQVPSLGTSFAVYACNIKGAKTWYPETACVYLKKGEKVRVKLSKGCDQMFCSVVEGGHFDQEKWESLDQDRLAFKCDENGNATSGLFASSKGGAK